MGRYEEYRVLYDQHDEYVERRSLTSWNAQQIGLEAREFKVPNMLSVLPADFNFESVIEIGCATGEVLSALPDKSPCGTPIQKKGFDISPKNIAAARVRYPHIEFHDTDFEKSSATADLVVLSDIIEHVPDDVDFLSRASALGELTVINLPLEDNWTNRNREYGINDSSGHLRAYTLDDAFQLLNDAQTELLGWQRLWKHETEYDLNRLRLRRELEGNSRTGGAPVRALKAVVYWSARLVRPFGRRLFPSNFFACVKAQSRVGDS